MGRVFMKKKTGNSFGRIKFEFDKENHYGLYNDIIACIFGIAYN